MKKLLILPVIIFTLHAEVKDLNITNNCEGLKIYDVEWKIKEKNWRGDRSSSLQYSIKNTTEKKLNKVHFTTYLKDEFGHRIMEESFSEGDIKPYYIKPKDKSRYLGISPAPIEFQGKGDLVITCEQPTIQEPIEKSTKTAPKKPTEFTDIKIPTKLFDAIKDKTKTKSEFETRIYILKTLVDSVK